MNAFDEFAKQVATETAKAAKWVSKSSDLGDVRLYAMELSRAVDYFYCRPLLTRQHNDETLSHLYNLGSSRALAAFIAFSKNQVGVPLVASTNELKNWSDSSIQSFGRLSYAEHLLELTRQGIYEVSQPTEKHFVLKMSRNLIDEESFDVADQEWLQTVAMEIDTKWHDDLSNRLPHILKRMRKLVRPWKRNFIAYDTDPVIDNHFEQAGILWGRGRSGQVELPGEAVIGGAPFYAYRAAIAVLCARALKHLSFAGELSLMHQNLDLRNLLSIWSTDEEWTEFFSAVLEIDEPLAKQLLWSVTLDSEYCADYQKVPAPPLPPLIRVSSNQLIMSLSGCLTSPFWFLSRKLRCCFRSDWDKVMDDREVEFRNELYTLFGIPWFIRMDRPIKLKSGKNEKTDIDALLFDTKHGSLALFQLKWQDPFGHSMKERRSKMKNFITESNRWIEIVSEWISGTTLSDLAARLRLDTSKTPLKRVDLIVLARHHARFSGSEKRSDKAVWGSWAQLCRIFKDHATKENDVLSVIADQLRLESLRSDSPRKVPTGSVKVGDAVVEIQSNYAAERAD